MSSPAGASVIVVGGGVTGLSAAWWLAREGADVLVLEAGVVGGEASGRNGGGLLAPFQPLVRRGAATVAADGCPARLPYRVPAQPDTGRAGRASDGAVRPGGDIAGGYFYHFGGHANPHRTVQAYAWALEDHGGRLMQRTGVHGFRVEAGRVLAVETSHGAFGCDALVLAAGPATGRLAALMGVAVPMLTARAEMIVTEPLPLMPTGAVALLHRDLSSVQAHPAGAAQPAAAAARDNDVTGALPDEALLHRLSEAAGPMAIAVGFPEEAGTGQVHNTQASAASGQAGPPPSQAVPADLWRPGRGQALHPRPRPPTIQLGEWRVAVLTCADLWNPALPWLAALAGVTLLLVPVASAAGAVDGSFDTAAGWDVVLRHTALLYGMPIAMANHATKPFWGGSRIMDAQGGRAAEAGSEPQLLMADLDSGHVRSARRLLPTRRDMNPELVLRELERHLDVGAVAFPSKR